MDRLKFLAAVVRAIQDFGPKGIRTGPLRLGLKASGLDVTEAELAAALSDLAQELEWLGQSVRVRPPRRGETKVARSGDFSLEECRQVASIYSRVRDEIHERNPTIIALACLMGRKRRGVEAQLIMCRHLERSAHGDGLGWGNAGSLMTQAFNEARGAGELLPSHPGVPTGKAGRQEVALPARRDGGAQASLSWLLERSFGGEDVAASPSRDDTSPWPEVGGPPGATELIEHLASVVASARGGTEWVFLLGGAGNGKSSLSRALARKVGARLPAGGIARRSYSHPNRKEPRLVILNDATIATRQDYKDSSRHALTVDLAGWLGSSAPPCVLANVNKGILIEEIRAAPPAEGKAGEVARALVAWLANGLGDQGGSVEVVTTSPGYYRQAKVKAGRRTITVHALSVDVSSLLEPGPVGPTLDLKAGACQPVPVIADFNLGATRRATATPGGLLLAGLLDAVREQAGARPDNCPLRCNAMSLAAPAPRANFLSFLRAAEVAGGQLLTFRDFWGVVSLTLVGPRDLIRASRRRAPRIEDHVDGLLQRIHDEGDPDRRFMAMARLAAHRSHVALLWQGSWDKPGAGPHRQHPLAEALSLIDGSSDFLGGWSNRVEDAMEEMVAGGRPSKVLAGDLADGSGWTCFDNLVEDVVVEAHAACSQEARRRELRAWYARYLLRFGSVFLGQFGHRRVVAEWCRVRASGSLAGPVNDGLSRLLIAPDYDQGVLRLPVFAPATAPVQVLREVRAPESVIVRIPASSYALSVEVREGRTWVQVRRTMDRHVVADVPLDFRLLREALATTQGAGFTEQGTDLAPRVERARTAIVAQWLASPGEQGHVRFIHDGKEEQ